MGVGVLGAHAWAEKAHLPGYAAYERCRCVAICDVVRERAEALAKRFGFEKVYTEASELLADRDVEMVDVCTPTDTHVDAKLGGDARKQACTMREAASHEAKDAFALADEAKRRQLRTKIGFTFRYSPALKQIKQWIEDGTLGDLFHVQGFQQNSQFLDPNFPLRQYTEVPDGEVLVPGSVVGYGSHLVDLMRWLAGDFRAVAALMRNYVPRRAIRGHKGLHEIPVEDGTVAAVEFESGAQGVIQTSFIAVGNYPGVEVRVYGSKGAAIARLISEFGVAETLRFATAGDVEFRQVELPASAFPPGTSVATPWPELYYRQLVRDWTDEILDGRSPDNTFDDGAMAQEIVNAIVLAHKRRSWVDLPLADRPQRFIAHQSQTVGEHQ